jgi:hypothetical protein
MAGFTKEEHIMDFFAGLLILAGIAIIVPFVLCFGAYILVSLVIIFVLAMAWQLVASLFTKGE